MKHTMLRNIGLGLVLGSFLFVMSCSGNSDASKTADDGKVEFDPLDSTKAESTPEEKIAEEKPSTEKKTIKKKKSKLAEKKTKAAEKSVKTEHITAAEAPSKVSKDTIYFVQLGMFKDKINAQKIVDQVKAKNYTTVIEPIENKTHGTLYRVRLEPFDSKSAAEESKAKLKADAGVDAFITSTTK